MAQSHVIDELVTLITLQFSPKTRREIQRIERSVDELKSNVRNELQRAGFAMDDFSDDVADMSRESRADLDRTGRATERLGQDVADMSRKVDRELDDSERSFGGLADSAKKTTRTVGAALGTLASVFLLKETSEFRAGIARIDNQLENLNFKQVEIAVIRISDLFAVNRDIVALLASQIDTELAPSVEAFESRLTTAVKLQKSLGLEDITHAQRLINVGFIVAPDSEALFADQVAAFLQRVPIVKEEIDGLATGIERAFATGIDPSAYLSLLSIGRFPSQEIAGAAVEDLGRELDEFKREGGVIDLAGLVSGTMDIPDTFGEQTTIYINQVRDMEDAQTRFIQNQAQYNAALGTQDQALRNISEATGDLARWMVWLENRAIQVGGVFIDLGGAFTGLLPAIGGAALTLQAFGLDLSGVGKAIKGFASAVRHPVRSLQRFWAWLLTSTTGLRTFATNLWSSGTAALGRFATSVRTNAIPALSRFATTIWTSTIGALRALGRRLAMASLAMLRFAGRAIVAGIAGVAAFAASIWTGAVPALAAFAAGVWATTVAMLANPLTWIVLAIVGLIAALVLLVKHWDTVKRVVRDFFDRYGNYVLAALAVVAPFIAVPLLIAKNWDQIVGFVGDIWSRVYDTVKGWIEAIISFIKEIPGKVKDAVKDIPNMVTEAVKEIPVVGAVISAVGGAADKVGGFFGKVKESFAQGGIVPGPTGRPLLATVHGGEMILPPSARQVLLDMFEGFRLGPAALPQAPPHYGQMYRSSVTNRTVNINMNEPIVIHTQATDAKGIAQELHEAMEDKIRNVAYDHDGPVER